MVRFIIYEDNVTMLEQEQLIVNKVCMGEDFDYKVDKFATYDPSIEKIINHLKGSGFVQSNDTGYLCDSSLKGII